MRRILLASLFLAMLSTCGCAYDGSTTVSTTPVVRFDVESGSDVFGKAPARGEARIVHLYADGTRGHHLVWRSVVKGQRLGFQHDGDRITSVIGETIEPVTLTPQTTHLIWEIETEHQRGWHLDLASLFESDSSDRRRYTAGASGSRKRNRLDRAQVAASKSPQRNDRGSRYGDSRDNDPGTRWRTRD